jgi:ornithine decarboxylase
MAAQFPDVRSMVAALKPSYPVYCLRPHVLRRNAQKFLDLFPGRVSTPSNATPAPGAAGAHQAGIRHFDTACCRRSPRCARSSRGRRYFMHPVKGRAVIRTDHLRRRYLRIDHLTS